MDSVWTTCSSKAARLELAGVHVRVELPARVGDRVRYWYPAWIERVFTGLRAAMAPDYAIYSSIQRAVGNEPARAALLHELQAGNGAAARRLATTMPPPVG